jgi:TetR/AcrR family transcriptional regulator, fatty acid metabolism regulator protein
MANVNQVNNEFLTRKGKQTQQAIINAGMSLIRAKGFSETSIKDICAEAKIGVGTFYHYFQSKMEVLLAFIDEENTNLLTFYSQMNKTSYGNAIMSVMNYYLDLYFQKGPELIAQIYSTVLFSEIEVVGHFLDNSFYNIVKDVFEKGQQSGEFTDQISVETLCNTFVGTWFFFTSMWCNKPEEYNIREIVNKHFPPLIMMVSTK